MVARLMLDDLSRSIDMNDRVIPDIYNNFLEIPSIREYLYTTATTYSNFVNDLIDHPITSNRFLNDLVGSSKSTSRPEYQSFSSLTSFDSSAFSIYPREFRFWILSRNTLPPFYFENKEELDNLLSVAPTLLPAWKHFPEQVQKWINDTEYRRSMWPYDTPLPEELAYDTLHPEAEELSTIPLVYDWSSEFPYRQAWLEVNKNLSAPIHLAEYAGEELVEVDQGKHAFRYTDGDYASYPTTPVIL